jgi:hypothetical protein
MNDFERCSKERRLIKIKPSKEIIQKELESARYDLNELEIVWMREILNGLLYSHIIQCIMLQNH